jgi:cytochrome c553
MNRQCRVSRWSSVWLSAAVSILPITPVIGADGDAARGRQVFEGCKGCHGISGYYNVYPSYRVPKLAGQPAQYIEQALKSYRGRNRVHPTMEANAASLSDRDIADVARYLERSGE